MRVVVECVSDDSTACAAADMEIRASSVPFKGKGGSLLYGIEVASEEVFLSVRTEHRHG